MRHLAGKWIVIDGVDLVGKTTQIARIGKALCDASIAVLVLHEWSASPVGEMIKRIVEEKQFFTLGEEEKSPLAETLSLLSDLIYKLETMEKSPSIVPVIVSDRGLLSLCAYQAVRISRCSVINQNDAVELVWETIRAWMARLRTPDFHVMLTLSPEELTRRSSVRVKGGYSNRDIAFLLEVARVMSKLVDRTAGIIIDVTGLKEADVTQLILRALEQHFTRPSREY